MPATPDPDTPRALFLDESGWGNDLLLSALSVPQNSDVLLRRDTRRLRGRLGALLPGFRTFAEFHGIELAGGLSDDERARILAEGQEPLESYQREFIYQHTLDFMASLPGAVIYTCHWRWKPTDKPKNEARFARIADRMFEWIDEHGYPIVSATFDRGHDREYRRAAREAQKRRQEDWDVSFVNSKSEPLVQLTDLAVYAAKQDCSRGQQGNKLQMVDWYQRHLGDSTFAPDGDSYGYRRYQGGACDQK